MRNYGDFLSSKRIVVRASGIHIKDASIHPALFPFQRDIVRWALKVGKSAIFSSCGTGKTLMQLEWARHIGGKCLILTPLAVAAQTAREAEKIGIKAQVCRSHHDVIEGINIANYERLHKFDTGEFKSIVLDESSILKAFDGKTRNQIIQSFGHTPYRLACTATPSPNDHMELGNHAEFLGVMSRTEMLSMFFVHDGGDTSKWRIKGHAEGKFWEWVASWACMLRRPSDLGYDDNGFILPELRIKETIIQSKGPSDGMLFPMPAETLQERRGARRASMADRVETTERMIRESWIKNKNENISEHTESPTGTKFYCGEKNGTRKTPNANGDDPGRLARPTANKNSPLKKSTTNLTEKNAAPICENGINANGKNLSPSTESGEPNDRTLNEIGICEQSTELHSRNITPCSKDRAGDAPSAVGKKKGLPLTTATNQPESGDCSAAVAITGLDDSETTPNGYASPQNISRTQWVVWCGLNAEQDAIAKLLGDDCVSIFGSLDADEKMERFERFSSGTVPVLITKASIFGWGINMQFSNNAIFLGLDDSYESFYQAIRRQWRFGQKNPVTVHTIIGSRETNVLRNVKRKEADLEKMQEGMVEHTHKIVEEHLKSTERADSTYNTRTETGNGWEMRLGDCVEEVRTIPPDSIHYSIFSPPFASLYTYSDSERDMGNCREHSEFYEHFKFLAGELYRVTMPGRLLSFHCMNLPASKTRDGYIGIHDFRGEMIRIFLDAGWIYHSEVCIWKDPVTAMQRTKALGLLHKQIKKDSTMSRQGIADYLVTMRKHGENPERVSHTAEEFPVSLWQRYASPVWMDINPSRTLQKTSAREEKDERHICPLQLDVIDRAIMLWTNPGDTVLSPFAGIGSEGHQAVIMGRKFLGIELKESYWKQAVANLAEASSTQGMALFK